jgi:pyridoxal phosphate enzyme (YggS family)
LTGENRTASDTKSGDFWRARITSVAVQSNFIAENVERVRERVARAVARCGRRADEITIVAVSKTFPAELIQLAYDAGLRHFGENRIQESEAKQATLAPFEATWHFIGHLQSNKVRRATHLFHRVDSIDSIPLVQKLDGAAAEEKKRLPVLIELRLAEEATKSGIAEMDFRALAQAVLQSSSLELLGVMTLPPYFDKSEDARPYFRKLRSLRDDMVSTLGSDLPVLSMGMSHDFEVAIEEGATEIRVGTDIFGARQKSD